jgi:hypothetical protein
MPSALLGPKVLLVIIVTALAAQGVYSVLDAAEIYALDRLLEAFPDTAHVPFAFDDPIGGISWATGFAGLCETVGEEYYHGLICGGGHIASIWFSDAWGLPQVSDFSFLSNLSYVTTFKDVSERLNPMECFPLVEALLPSASISFISLRWPSDRLAEWSLIESEVSLKVLRGPVPPSFNFSQLSLLESFYAWSNPTATWDISPVASTLGNIGLEGLDMSDESQMELILQLPSLTQFECENCVWPLPASGFVDIVIPSTSFDALVLRNPLGPGATGTFRISNPGNTAPGRFEFYDFQTTPIEIMDVSSALYTFQMYRCANVPVNLTSLVNVQNLVLEEVQNTSWPAGLANWSGLSPRYIRIEANFTQPDLDNILCSLDGANLLTLYIRDRHSQSLTLPVSSCTGGWLAWETLVIDGNFQFDADTLLTNLPPSIEALFFDSAFQKPVGFTPSWFSTFSDLARLEILNNEMTGSIPDLFFSTKTALEILSLSNNSFEGTIPYQALNQLVELHLDGNLFTSWPSPSASLTNMQVIELQRNLLQEIPTDDAFSRMLSLWRFDISDNPTLNLPVPTFWANHSSLSYARMARCNLTGTLPNDITSPFLLELDLSENPEIYGELPSKSVWITRLNGNSLSGGIPATWADADSPIYEIQLQNNQFNESIISTWLSSLTSSQAHLIDLSYSAWAGNIFDMSHLTKSLTFKMLGTQIDFCSFNPDFNHVLNVTIASDVCYFDNTTACGCLASSFTSCGGIPLGLSCNTPSAPSSSPSGPTPSACSGIPLPDGFTCRSDGQVVAESSIIAPKLEMPPNLGTVVVQGNLTISTSLILNGVNTKLVVEGCAIVPEGVGVKFTEEEVDEAAKAKKSNGKTSSPIPSDPQTLLTQRENCPTSLKLVPVTVDTPKSCRKVKADSSSSTPSSLNVTFKLDTSGCNTKWIILGGVLGGVIVIGAIVILLLVKFNSNFRSKVLPYYGAN